MVTFWVILLRVAWVVVVLLSSLMTLLMFAFADSPGAGKAAQKMIGPIFIATIAIFAAGAWLLQHGTGWSIACAFAVVITPPFLVFLGYNVLMK